jgi:peptide/nickel transport system ATP-binding protein
LSELIKIRDLVITYPSIRGPLRAVDGVSLAVNRGEAFGLVGESGCGKTTLGSSLLRLVTPSNGSIEVGSVDVGALHGEELRRYRWERVAIVFQSSMNALDPVRDIGSQIQETILQHRRMSRQKARDLTEDLLELTKIDPRYLRSYPHQLSGGMRQRVAIALAVCLGPEVLVADEPTSSLDVVAQADILLMLKEMQAELDLTLFLITHDMAVAAAVCDRIGVMYAGKLVECGPVDSVIRRPQHPYTSALLAASPELGQGSRTLQEIPGYPPDLVSPPTGCRFHPRCRFSFGKCQRSEPVLKPIGDGQVACWLRDDTN